MVPPDGSSREDAANVLSRLHRRAPALPRSSRGQYRGGSVPAWPKTENTPLLRATPAMTDLASSRAPAILPGSALTPLASRGHSASLQVLRVRHRGLASARAMPSTQWSEDPRMPVESHTIRRCTVSTGSSTTARAIGNDCGITHSLTLCRSSVDSRKSRAETPRPTCLGNDDLLH